MIRKNCFSDYEYKPHNIYSECMSRETALFHIALLSKDSLVNIDDVNGAIKDTVTISNNIVKILKKSIKAAIFM